MVTQLLICVFAAATGVSLFSSAMAGLTPVFVYSLYLAATVLIGGLTGFQFARASLINSGNYAEVSGKTYSFDLFGSALGALAVTLYLVPRLGIVVSVFIIGFINLAFGGWLLLKNWFTNR